MEDPEEWEDPGSRWEWDQIYRHWVSGCIPYPPSRPHLEHDRKK